MKTFLQAAAVCGLLGFIGCDDTTDDMIPNVVPGQYEPVEDEPVEDKAQLISSDQMGSIESEGETITFVDPNSEDGNNGESNAAEELPVKDKD